MLKRTIFALAIGFLPVTSSAQHPHTVKGMNAAGLFSLCGATEPFWSGVCYGYARAVADMSDPDGTRFCLEDMEPRKILEAIYHDLYGKTDLHFMPAGQAVVMAFDKHFHC